MVIDACPGQIPISCVPLTLMVTATVVRACRYTNSVCKLHVFIFFAGKYVMHIACLHLLCGKIREKRALVGTA